MSPLIGINLNQFGPSEALALYFIRTLQEFSDYKVVDISEAEKRSKCCDITIGCGNFCDMASNHFTDNSSDFDLTLGKMVGIEYYDQLLSAAGLVYAKFGYQLLFKKFTGRYDTTNKFYQKNLNRDFRKIYEYFIEVVDTYRWRRELSYPTFEKNELLAFLIDLNNRICNFGKRRTANQFVLFAEEVSREIGGRFEQTLYWYKEKYVPSFDALVNAIQNANNYGVIFCDFNFSDVSFNDLLARAASTQRLPRLFIRPVKSKFRIDSVKFVKPMLNFPTNWIGNEDYVFELLAIKDVVYISSGQDFAITKTFAAAFKLAKKLLEHAETEQNLVVSQESPHLNRNSERRPIWSLPTTRDSSTCPNENDSKKQNKSNGCLDVGMSYYRSATINSLKSPPPDPVQTPTKTLHSYRVLATVSICCSFIFCIPYSILQ